LRNAIKFLVALAVAILLMVAVRTWAFAIYRVNHSLLAPAVRSNDRVMVNKLRRVSLRKGDLVVFRTDSAYIGRVKGLPGDTIRDGGSTYCVAPNCGCDDCDCDHCCQYLMDVGSGYQLVPERDIIGKAYRLSLK